MAEIGFVPGVGQQIVLIFTLRWQLFRNSLRTLGGRLEAAALAVIVLFGVSSRWGPALSLLSAPLPLWGTRGRGFYWRSCGQCFYSGSSSLCLA